MYVKSDVKNPIEIKKMIIGGKNILRLIARIPTPFVWVRGVENLDQNFFFLAPIDGWREIDVAITREYLSVDFLSFWSYVELEEIEIKPHVQFS